MVPDEESICLRLSCGKTICEVWQEFWTKSHLLVSRVVEVRDRSVCMSHLRPNSGPRFLLPSFSQDLGMQPTYTPLALLSPTWSSGLENEMLSLWLPLSLFSKTNNLVQATQLPQCTRLYNGNSIVLNSETRIWIWISNP